MASKFNSEFNYRYQVKGETPWEKIKTLHGFLEGRKAAAKLEEVAMLRDKAAEKKIQYLKETGAPEHEIIAAEGTKINEQTIIKKATKAIKPDRVVLKGNSAYLLDYKTGEKHHKHKVQIEEYELALREMNYSVAKKALIYIGESIEIVTL
jgi:predicted RecB family nuclease